MRPQVYIPSRGRWQVVRKLTNIWQDKGFDVHWVVEPSEVHKYALPAIAKEMPARVHALNRENGGIAWSRNFCVELAASNGLKSFLLADDDIKPSTRRPDGMKDIVEACEHPKILGMTARYSYHDLCLGPDIEYMDDIILCPTGTFRLVGLNVDNVLKIGNYDWTLEYGEDCDLFLRGLKWGFPWLVHLGSYANSIGTRYEPGGMLDFTEATVQGGVAPFTSKLALKKAQWHNDLNRRYPDIVNKHTERCGNKQNCIIVSWKRAYDKYLPDWRKWSELDGGDLQRYIDAPMGASR